MKRSLITIAIASLAWASVRATEITVHIPPTQAGDVITLIVIDPDGCDDKPREDVNCDGQIDITDCLQVKSKIGMTPTPGPTSQPSQPVPTTQPAASVLPGPLALPTPIRTLVAFPDTLQSLINAAQPGDDIRLSAGAYGFTIFNRVNGTAQHPISMRPVPGAKVTFSPTVQSSGIIRILNAHYIFIDGIEASGNKFGAGIIGEDADGLVVQRCITHDNSGGCGIIAMASDDVTICYNDSYKNGMGIKATFADQIQIFNPDGSLKSYKMKRGNRAHIYCNMAHDNLLGGGSDGIQVNGGDDAVIEYNLAWQNYDDGIDNSAGGAGTNYSLRHLIRFNAAWRNGPTMACPAAGFNGSSYADCASGQSMPETWKKKDDGSYALNPDGTHVIGDSGNGAGIKVSTNAGGDSIIHHNIVFQNTLAGIDCDQEADWGPNRFYNNTVYANLHKGIALDMAGVTANRSAASCVNNLLAENLDPSEYGGDLRVSGTFSINQNDHNYVGDGLGPVGDDRLDGDAGAPMFVDPSAPINTNYTGAGGVEGKYDFIAGQIERNFSLKPGSPCIDAGRPITDGTLNVTAGFNGTAPDIGAVER